MASHMQTSFLIFAFLISSFFIPSQSQGGQIAVYWGQNGGEGTLTAACATGLYEIVIIAFLNTFGSGRTPALSLTAHCDTASGTCTSLSNDIKFCQGQGVNVLLSIGGPSNSYSLTSEADARQVAYYLWDNYLGGQSSSRPLGDAVLNGIDFHIEFGNGQFYDVLATTLKLLNPGLVLSAAPQCLFPDTHLDTAIQSRQFDYVWIRFYNNPSCDYKAGNSQTLVTTWKRWQNIPANSIFLGLPASQAAGSSGFIPQDVLINEVLPKIKTTPTYGGVMLWNRYYDHGYSAAIKGSVSMISAI